MSYRIMRPTLQVGIVILCLLCAKLETAHAQDAITHMNNTYHQDYWRQLEMAYGNGLMSEGGTEAIDHMLQGVTLKNKTILDFGSGLGGLAIYLADKHHAHLVGLEINPAMIKEANSRIPTPLTNTVSFQVINETLIFPFPDNHFDVVVSKGVITHLTQEQRNIVFEEFHRVLKKGGTLVIQDWLSPIDGQWGPRITALSESESIPLFAHSIKSYGDELKKHHFIEVTSQDTTKDYVHYNQAIVNHLQELQTKETFITAYGESTYREHLKGYQDIRDAHHVGELLSVRLRAKKA